MARRRHKRQGRLPRWRRQAVHCAKAALAAAWRGGIVPPCQQRKRSDGKSKEPRQLCAVARDSKSRRLQLCTWLTGSRQRAAGCTPSHVKQVVIARKNPLAPLGQHAGLHARDIEHEAREQPKHDKMASRLRSCMRTQHPQKIGSELRESASAHLRRAGARAQPLGRSSRGIGGSGTEKNTVEEPRSARAYK